MSATRFETTPLRAAAAILAGLAAGVVAAQMLVWGAFSALGPAEWFALLLDHLQTKWLDYGPSFVVALLVWLGFHHAGWRDLWMAVLVGVLSFYLAPKVVALLFLLQSPYWLFDFALFAPRWGELLTGAFLAALMWLIAYWKPNATG